MNQPEFDYFGPYRVEGVLGRGGMGTVYKGSHARSGEKVAIKVIAAAVADQSRFRRRFAAEIDTLKRLKHPHIVELIGYGEEQGLLFYSMEYVPGHSLLEHMRQHRVLPWEDVIQIGIETSAALKHAHDLGIIHRDLKPANLMLSDLGQVKLTDFGIAKLFGSTDMTAAGSVIGTADYMPPEQAEGKTITTRSDLYSLGCVLYALLAGRAPFGGKSVPEVLYAVRYNAVPDLMGLAPNCPVELAELIKEMVEKDPQKRPPTALVIGNRLKAIQAGMRKLASPTKATQEDGKPVEKIGKELTSLDLSDDEDNEIRLTHPEVASTHELPTMLAPPPSGAVNTAPQEPSDSFITNHDRTSVLAKSDSPANVAARTDKTRRPIPSSPPPSAGDPITTTGPGTNAGSRFTQVTDSDVRASVFGTAADTHTQQSDWIQYASIATLIGVLLFSIASAWWMFRPASADQLFEDISAQLDSNDDEAIAAARPMINEFLERFPEDKRRAEIQAIADDDDLTRAFVALKRRAARKGESLSALDQGFLDCLEARQRNPDEYQRKLESFITVFGKLDGLSIIEKRLVELAIYASKTQPTLKLEIPPATTQLEKLIRSAEAELSGKELINYYKSLLELYAGKPWAAEQLVRIRERIKSDEANGK
ncbi:MAG: serine/threonine-protein kinase [Pirellulaceae bacterium]|nr:serine/threonine-protein kinase [Pirellulaceae bacterium]